MAKSKLLRKISTENLSQETGDKIKRVINKIIDIIVDLTDGESKP